MSNILEWSRSAVIAALADKMVSLHVDYPLRVAVDGRSAAGKTTLSDELAKAVQERTRGVLRASIDHFHYPGHKKRSQQGEWTAQSYYEYGYDYTHLPISSCGLLGLEKVEDAG